MGCKRHRPSDSRRYQASEDAHAEFAKVANDPKLDSGTLFGDRKRIGTDHLRRTMGVVMGIFGNVREQAVFIPVPLDAKGNPLDGSKAAYTITFQKGQMPPVKFFWSYTMYKLPQRWLVETQSSAIQYLTKRRE